MTPARDKDGRLCVGFTVIGGPGWVGGMNYLRTLLRVITHDLADRFSACLLIAPSEEDLARKTYGDLAGVRIVVDPRASGAGAGRRALSALVTGRDAPFAQLASEQGIGLMFETARFFGRGFPAPVLSWIPDFQHRHLHHLFPAMAWWKRDLGFRAQCAGSRIILLSSAAAEADCLRFYPSARGKTRVARFTASVDIERATERAASVREAYALPDRFIFLPNQFWLHKNHRVVIDCLHLLKAEGAIDRALPIVLSGHTQDPRNPSLFADSTREIEAGGIAGWFRHLGTLPYSDVLALNSASRALLNPSLFEGWSSTLEEAKALGTPLILSDIPTHREQAAVAHFFEARSPRALAEVLLKIADAPQQPRPATSELLAAHAKRHAAFVDALRGAFDAAVAAPGRQT
jgi:glycosyltransferase involved in cell wall biosynthesis